ncbi:MAG: hypothetical protein AAFU34_11500 [Pseudomonadota bacterium]
MTQTAQETYQHVLDRVDAAISTADYDLLRRHVALPYRMVTSRSSQVFQTEAELKELFLTFAHSIAALGVDNFHRVAGDCRFIDPVTILGNHTTYVRRGNEDMVPPYPSLMTMYKSGKDWQITEAQNAIENSEWPILVPKTLDTAPAAPSEPGRELRKALFQSVLDRFTDAIEAKDHHKIESCLSFPFTLIGHTGAKTLTDAASVQAELAAFWGKDSDAWVTQIVREAISTEMVGADQMIGVYRTHAFRGGSHVVPPWDSSVTLRNEKGLWRATSIMRPRPTVELTPEDSGSSQETSGGPQ